MSRPIYLVFFAIAAVIDTQNFFSSGSGLDHKNSFSYKKGNREYIFVQLDATVDGAEQLCRDRGFELVSMETEALNLNMEFWLQPQLGRGEAWTSGKRKSQCTKDCWFWSLTGEKFTETDWVHAEEDKKEGCMYVKKTGEGTIKWYAGNCATKRLFICQKRF